jgi:hypothetical protein
MASKHRADPKPKPAVASLRSRDNRRDRGVKPNRIAEVTAPSASAATPASSPGLTRCRFEIYGAKNPQHLQTLAAMGFDQITAQAVDVGQLAGSMGLSVVLENWWNTGTAWDAIRQTVESALTISGLVSINMMDEPEINGIELHPPELYASIRQRILDQWPRTPLSITFYGPDLKSRASKLRTFTDYLRTIDILRIDPYPIVAKRPLAMVHEWIDLSRYLMRQIARPMPLTVILQTWSDTEDTAGRPQLPPVESLRVMAYMAILAGIDTLSFHSYDPDVWDRVPGFTAGFTKLMRELRSLADELVGARVDAVMGGDGIYHAEIARGAHQWSYTINTSFAPTGRMDPLQIHRAPGRGRDVFIYP